MRLPCFTVPTGHEISARGKKLVGSAQKRNKDGFLQHGSILLHLDGPLWRKIMRLEPEVDLGAVSLSDLSPRPIGAAELTEALQEEFRCLFREPESACELTPHEKAAARDLAVVKYSSMDWNHDRIVAASDNLAPNLRG
jgi:lipoate-protein ligase A